jgi:hypothetical protein
LTVICNNVSNCVTILLECCGQNCVYDSASLLSVGAPSRVDLRKFSDFRDCSPGEVSFLLFNTENRRILIRIFAKIVGRIQAYVEGYN